MYVQDSKGRITDQRDRVPKATLAHWSACMDIVSLSADYTVEVDMHIFNKRGLTHLYLPGSIVRAASISLHEFKLEKVSKMSSSGTGVTT